MVLDSACYTLGKDYGRVLREVTDALNCQQKEADIRLMFHLDLIMQISPISTVSVRSNGTDVLVLLVCYAGVAHNCPNLWMDVGLSWNNIGRYICILKLVDYLDPTIIQGLPGLHAFATSFIFHSVIYQQRKTKTPWYHSETWTIHCGICDSRESQKYAMKFTENRAFCVSCTENTTSTVLKLSAMLCSNTHMH